MMKEGPEVSAHARQMLQERNIRDVWLQLTLSDPDRLEEKQDGTVHYIKRIPEHGGRYLRVVVSLQGGQRRVVTAFFDRRLRRVQ